MNTYTQMFVTETFFSKNIFVILPEEYQILFPIPKQMKCKLLKDFSLFYLMAFLLLVFIIFFIGLFLYGEEELSPIGIRYPVIWGICYAYQEVFYFVQRYIPLFFPCAFLSVALLAFPLGALFALIINGLLNKIDLEKK
ncbi:MAG: hypothetical protein ACFNP4_11705 [Capnocytophaga gingivalis]|jgi:hypothetical protein